MSEEIDFSVDTADASEGVRITKKLTEEEYQLQRLIFCVKNE